MLVLFLPVPPMVSRLKKALRKCYLCILGQDSEFFFKGRTHKNVNAGGRRAFVDSV